MSNLNKQFREEQLSDNTKMSYCEQCQDCVLQSDGTPYSNRYDKSNCMMYSYPETKPDYVINNFGDCIYKAT